MTTSTGTTTASVTTTRNNGTVEPNSWANSGTLAGGNVTDNTATPTVVTQPATVVVTRPAAVVVVQPPAPAP